MEKVDQLLLLGRKVADPVVVDVHRKPGTAIEESVAEAANQAEAGSSGVRGHNRGRHPLNLFSEEQSIIWHEPHPKPKDAAAS